MITKNLSKIFHQSLIDQDEPFYFADICAGPGGFSEYILWKKKWQAKGKPKYNI